MKTKRIRIFLIAAIIGIGLLSFMLSAQNATESTSLSDKIMIWLGLVSWRDVANKSMRYNIWIHVIRQGAHFMLYAIGALPVFLLIYTYKEKVSSVFFLTLGSVALYALVDELHQLFVTGRSFQLIDLATDVSGAFCTSIVLAIVTYVTNTIYHDHNYSENDKSRV